MYIVMLHLYIWSCYSVLILVPLLCDLSFDGVVTVLVPLSVELSPVSFKGVVSFCCGLTVESSFCGVSGTVVMFC